MKPGERYIWMKDQPHLFCGVVEVIDLGNCHRSPVFSAPFGRGLSNRNGQWAVGTPIYIGNIAASYFSILKNQDAPNENV